jgi:drug/metabolite transporter (DMT)-like permease
MSSIVVWLSLAASILYTLGVLFIKRSTRWRFDAWRLTFICNLLTAIMFLPLLGLGGTIPSAALLWQPAVVALLFLSGQVFTIVALTRGDVSVATPMLGLKILMVAALAYFLSGDPITTELWIAAALASVAVALLSVSGGRASHSRVGFTAICSVAAAGSLALFDVLVQMWSPAWGVGRFMPLMILAAAAFSVLLIPRFEARLTDIDPLARRWILLGGGLIGLQSVIFTSTIAVWGHAAIANVVYSSRGLWSVIMIALFGHWFSESEYKLGARILAIRLIGAALLTTAVFLALGRSGGV